MLLGSDVVALPPSPGQVKKLLWSVMDYR
jgi:hypothetical protein